MRGQSPGAEKEAPWRRKPGRLVLLLVVVLVLGIAAGICLNLLLGNSKEKSNSGEKAVRETADSGEELEGRQATFDSAEALKHIFALSKQMGNRPPGSVKESQTADYLAERLAEYGFTVEEQAFSFTGNLGSRNIIATRSGTKSGYTMIIGAHYDSSLGGEGAVDNASGVSVVLELARVFSSVERMPELKFVFFGANGPELPDQDERLAGSNYYVDLLGSMEKEELIGVIAVDCVGTGDPLMLITSGTGPQRLKNKLETYLRGKAVPVEFGRSDSDSDSLPFEVEDIPAAWIRWGEEGDLKGNDFAAVEQIKIEAAGKYLEEFISGLTDEDLKELKY